MFKKALMENDKYKSWLKPGTSVYSTKCSFCVSEFNVAWRSESAVRSHECGSAHVRNMTDLEKAKSLAPLFFRKTPVHSGASSSSASSICEKLATASPSNQSTTIGEFVSQQAYITRVEIIGPASVKSYKIGVVGNNWLVGWLVGNAVFSETALRIFLIFA